MVNTSLLVRADHISAGGEAEVASKPAPCSMKLDHLVMDAAWEIISIAAGERAFLLGSAAAASEFLGDDPRALEGECREGERLTFKVKNLSAKARPLFIRVMGERLE